MNRHERRKPNIPLSDVTKLKIEMAKDALHAKGIKTPYVKLNEPMGRARSNKYTCGHLGELCQMLRDEGIPYPWLTA